MTDANLPIMELFNIPCRYNRDWLSANKLAPAMSNRCPFGLCLNAILPVDILDHVKDSANLNTRGMFCENLFLLHV